MYRNARFVVRSGKNARRLFLEPLEARRVLANVGYYDMYTGQGETYAEAPIIAAGHTPVQITEPNSAQLAGLAALFVTNPSNDDYGAEYLANLADIQAAVQNGMTLIIHDRYVDPAETILPGGDAFDIRRREPEGAADIDVRDNSTSITDGTGPGGAITNTSLDGGLFSSHGFSVAGTLPADALLVLTRSNPEEIVTFVYCFGAGAVIYSSIPLDAYLEGFGSGTLNTNMSAYAANVLAYEHECVVETDFGDAPDSYGTLAASAGASHGVGELLLGETIDAEDDGLPSAAADGDDLDSPGNEGPDDEDGVTLPALLIPGVAASASVSVVGEGVLDAWIDFNGDGDFDAEEQIFASLPVAGAANVLGFEVPRSAVGGATYARFRLSSAGGLGPTGPAADGEVEDYLVTVLTCGSTGGAQLVADPSTPENTVLLVCGTELPDAIAIQPAAGGVVQVQINPFGPIVNVPFTFSKIVVLARGSSDAVSVHASFFTPATIYGDDGNDSIKGGSGNDLIFGGAGVDSLSGEGGDDVLDGGEGADSISGGFGNDVLTGGRGNDRLLAGPGTDRLVETGSGAFTLSPTLLKIGAETDVLRDFERATLTGSAAADSFTVSAWPNPAAVDGRGGNDHLIAAGNANFTLTDTLLTRSVGGPITLASIESAELTGGTSANTLDASAFSGGVKLDGGAGNDVLKSGAGPALLLGGTGNDMLTAGAGRTVQIGGAGADKLNGGGEDDLLIEGTTSFDSNAAALSAILAEWASAATYADRVKHLKGTLAGGLNGATKLTATTTQRDTAVDVLTGGGGQEWFFAKLVNPAKDTLVDAGGGEQIN